MCPTTAGPYQHFAKAGYRRVAKILPPEAPTSQTDGGLYHRAPGLGRLTSPPEQVLEGSLELWVAELVARLFELRRFDALARQEQLVGELP